MIFAKVVSLESQCSVASQSPTGSLDTNLSLDFECGRFVQSKKYCPLLHPRLLLMNPLSGNSCSSPTRNAYYQDPLEFRLYYDRQIGYIRIALARNWSLVLQSHLLAFGVPPANVVPLGLSNLVARYFFWLRFYFCPDSVFPLWLRNPA